jgi:hypothetical protein
MALSSNLRSRLVGVVVSAGLLVLLLPAAVVVTIMLFPLWSWIEDSFHIESVGHSGPAGWCYMLVFALLVGSVIPGFWVLRWRHRHGLVMAKPRP